MSVLPTLRCEPGQDWSTLSQELTKLMSDGRDVLDATQFLTGTGTDSPAGVLTGLSTTQRVLSAEVGGAEPIVYAGSRVAASDPRVKGRESLFEASKTVDLEPAKRRARKPT